MRTTQLSSKPLVLVAALAMAVASSQAFAAVEYFTFSGSNEGGTGSATMSIDIVGNTLTAILNNTSPVNLDEGTAGGNSPGIAGFGFELDPDDLVLSSWQLIAKTSSATDITIGSSTIANLDWVMGTTQDGLTLDYLPQVESGVDGLIFNPAAFTDTNNTIPGGTNSSYFTTATLTMVFATAPTLDAFLGNCTANDPCSPFIRMQNVGLRGEGSLKLPGTPYDPNVPPITIPEPASLALLGLGLLGLAATRRRKV